MASLREIVFSLHTEQFTGKLHLKKDQVEKTIFFRKGVPIYIDSSLRNETLGHLLLEQGKLTEEQFNKTLEVMQTQGKRQGEIIVELGFLSGYEVYEALQAQGARKLQNCFLLDDPDITSEEGEKYLIGVPEIAIDLFRVYLDVAAAVYIPGESIKPDPSALSLTETGKKYLANQSLRPTESKITRLLDGKRSLSQILEVSMVDPDEANIFMTTLTAFKFIENMAAPPQRFTVPASKIAQQPATPKEGEGAKRLVVEIKSDKPPPASPIYAFVLKLERPYYDLLGIDPSATRFQARKRYEELIREYHLDSIESHYVDKDRKIAEQVLDRLTLALTVLSDDKRKHEYVQTLAKTKLGTTTSLPNDVIAEVAVQKAKLHVAKKRYGRAEEEFRKAIELSPKESSYHIELAEMLIQKAAAEKQPFPSVIEQELKQALTLNNADFQAFYQLGILYKLKGDIEKARGYFSKTVELKPNHPQASTELRLIARRTDERKKGESTLLKLFKKKDKE